MCKWKFHVFSSDWWVTNVCASLAVHITLNSKFDDIKQLWWWLWMKNDKFVENYHWRRFLIFIFITNLLRWQPCQYRVQCTALLRNAHVNYRNIHSLTNRDIYFAMISNCRPDSNGKTLMNTTRTRTRQNKITIANSLFIEFLSGILNAFVRHCICICICPFWNVNRIRFQCLMKYFFCSFPLSLSLAVAFNVEQHSINKIFKKKLFALQFLCCFLRVFHFISVHCLIFSFSLFECNLLMFCIHIPSLLTHWKLLPHFSYWIFFLSKVRKIRNRFNLNSKLIVNFSSELTRARTSSYLLRNFSQKNCVTCHISFTWFNWIDSLFVQTSIFCVMVFNIFFFQKTNWFNLRKPRDRIQTNANSCENVNFHTEIKKEQIYYSRKCNFFLFNFWTKQWKIPQ